MKLGDIALKSDSILQKKSKNVGNSVDNNNFINTTLVSTVVLVDEMKLSASTSDDNLGPLLCNERPNSVVVLVKDETKTDVELRLFGYSFKRFCKKWIPRQTTLHLQDVAFTVINGR